MNVVILSPHVDDGCLGCGGTIAKMVEDGYNVYYVTLSNSEKSLPSDFPRDTLLRELEASLDVLEVPKENRILLDFETRLFSRDRQEILDDLIKIRREYNPSIVIAPSLKDFHQDHKVVAEETIRAFKKTASTILFYEAPWNQLDFTTLAFHSISPSHLQRKIDSLLAFKSQASKEYTTPAFLRGLAKVRGVQIGKEYAEAFEVIRMVL